MHGATMCTLQVQEQDSDYDMENAEAREKCELTSCESWAGARDCRVLGVSYAPKRKEHGLVPSRYGFCTWLMSRGSDWVCTGLISRGSDS